MGPNIVECVVDALVCEAWWPESQSILDSAIVNPGDTLRPCLRPRDMPEDRSYLCLPGLHEDEEPLRATCARYSSLRTLQA
jgi:hypothetical protein